MSYPNQSGGISISAQGKTIWIGYLVAGAGFEAYALMEAIGPGQWEARWNSGFKPESDNKADITAAGGEVYWIKKFTAAINNAIGIVFGTATPVPPGTTTQDKVNAATASGFALTIGANGVPVFAAK